MRRRLQTGWQCENEIRIAMDDVLTIFDNAPRSGCLAPEQVKEASWVVFVIPVQSYVRGRPSKAMPCFQTKHLLELQWASARDMVLVGCGHDPSGVQAVMSKLKQFEALKSCTWSPLVAVVRARARRKHYVEYMLQGVGPKCPCTESVPCFVHSKKGYPSIKLRPRRCGKPIPGIVAGSGENSAEEGQTVCGTHTWARGRYMAHLPNQPPVLRTKQQNKDDFEELGVGGDDGAAQDESPDSEEGSVEALGMGSDPESEDVAPIPALQKGREWYDSWRWGWAEETWKAFLEPLCPPLSVLCGSVHAQPGLLMAVLSYNEERYGLDRCNMIAFYPRSGVVKEEGVRPKAKAIEQAHMVDHVLASVSAVYADFRLAASKAVRKRHLFRVASREAEPAAKLAKTDREKPAGIVAAGSLPGGMVTSTGAGAGSGSSHNIKATMFIGVFGNSGPSGPKVSLIALPADKSAEDSDTEPCGGDAGDLRHAVVSKRNMVSMTKHRVKIMKSSGPEGVGNGVFTTSDMSAGATLLAKGILLTDKDQLNTWLNQQHPLTGQAMSRNIVEVHFSRPPEGNTHHVLLRHDRFGGVCERIHRHHSAAERPVGFQP